MSSDPTSTASPSSAAIPLETEPLVFFHPSLAGLVTPGSVQPVTAAPPARRGARGLATIHARRPSVDLRLMSAMRNR